METIGEYQSFLVGYFWGCVTLTMMFLVAWVVCKFSK